jgi:hypothetical protein
VPLPAPAGFEVWDRRARRGSARRQGETVTVGRNGTLSLSMAAWSRLGEPAAITFGVIPAAGRRGPGGRRLALQPATPRAQNSYAVRAYRSNHLISGRAVLKYLGADLSESRRYPLHADGGQWWIDLDDDAAVVTRPRRPRGVYPIP